MVESDKLLIQYVGIKYLKKGVDTMLYAVAVIIAVIAGTIMGIGGSEEIKNLF